MKLSIGLDDFGPRSPYCSIDPGTAMLAGGALSGIGRLFGGGGRGAAPIQQISRQENTQMTDVNLTNIVGGGGPGGQMLDWSLSAWDQGRDLYTRSAAQVTDAFGTVRGYPLNGQTRAIQTAFRSPGVIAPAPAGSARRPPRFMPLLIVAAALGFLVLRNWRKA